jgi:DNA-binding PadR family transcriptional regulator
MEYIILGLLMIRNLTQYDILKALEKEVSPFYSASLGSIQNALKRLSEKSLIVMQTVESSNRGKNIFSITDEGMHYFRTWMLSESSREKLENELPNKLFFMGHLSKNDRKALIQTNIQTLKTIIDAYSLIQVASSSVEADKIMHYQLKTLKLGLSYFESTLTFMEDLLIEEEAVNYE